LCLEAAAPLAAVIVLNTLALVVHCDDAARRANISVDA
jgi:hypothetical protein